MIREYITKLLHKWIGKFSLIAGFIGGVEFWTELKVQQPFVNFIWENFFIISIVLFFIASYQVWKEVKNELNKLNKNPVDYDVIATIRKVFITIEDIKKYTDSNLSKIDGLIEEVDKKIFMNGPENNLNINNNISKKVKEFNIINQMINGQVNGIKSDKNYLIELQSYKKELINYQSKIENYLNKWEQFIANDLKNIYYVHFEIKNIGRESDKNIDVEIKLSNSNKQIESIKKLDNYPEKLYLPIEPSRKSAIDDYLLNTKYMIADMEYTHDMRKNEKVNDYNLSINLRNIHVGDTIDIFKKDAFFINIEQKEKIKVIIKSEKSKFLIEKDMKFNEEEQINYIQIGKENRSEYFY